MICEKSLEGIVAKRLSSRYLPDGREWVKVKNRAYWRYPYEVAAAQRRVVRVTI